MKTIKELDLSEDKREKMIEAFKKRGYLSNDVFTEAPEFELAPKESKYEYIANVYKWNTRSNQLIMIGVRFDKKQDRYILSYYKQGSTKRNPHGESMR